MSQILERYCQYLLKLNKTRIINQFPLVCLQKPQKYEKQQCINMLLQADLSFIQKRLVEIEEQSTGSPSDGLVQMGGSGVESGHKSSRGVRTRDNAIELKLAGIRNHIYQQLHEQFDKNIKESSDLDQLERQRNKKLTLEDLLGFKTVPANLVLNCQQQIQLHPQKVQFQYQRNLNQLLYYIFPNKTVKQLEAKIKLEVKDILPAKISLQGKIVHKILVLYGLRKEEQFLKDLKDPLQTLILQIGQHSPKLSTVLLFLDKFSQRQSYYNAIISSMELPTLQMFVQVSTIIQRLESLSKFVRISRSIEIGEMIRENKQLFNREYYPSLLRLNTHIPQGVLNRQNLLFIQNWFLKIMDDFRKSVQAHGFSKQEQLRMVQSTVAYKKLKVKIMDQLFQISKNRGYLLGCLKGELNEYEGKDQYNILQVLSAREPQTFNERLFEVILFLEGNISSSSQLVQRVRMYRGLLEYFVLLQRIVIPVHILHKIVADNISILSREATSASNVDQKVHKYLDKHYICYLIQLIYLQNSKIDRIYLHQLFQHLWLRYCWFYQDTPITQPSQAECFMLILQTVSLLLPDHHPFVSSLFQTMHFSVMIDKFIDFLAQIDKIDQMLIKKVLIQEILPKLTDIETRQSLIKKTRAILLARSQA